MATTPEPHAKNLAHLYDLAPLDWADVRRTLEANLTQDPGTGGPGHHTFWLSTIDADGRPHLTAVGANRVEGRYYFSGGPRSRKIRNIEREPRCAFGVAIHGYDVALEGPSGAGHRRCPASASRPGLRRRRLGADRGRRRLYSRVQRSERRPAAVVCL
jgi:hypothetical protein